MAKGRVGPGNVMFSTTITLPIELRDAIVRAAKAADVKYSVWLRHAAAHYLSCQKSQRQDTDGQG